MTLTEMIAETALILKNMKSAHPWYSQITGYLNRGANEVILMAVGGNAYNMDLFPELKNSWTVGPTVAGENVITNPADCIAVQTVHRAESSTSPDWAITKELPLGYIAPEPFGILYKADSSAGYAKIFSRKGKSVLIWPTPTSDYIDYLRFYGLKSESEMTSGSDSLYMDEKWHDAVVLLAAQRIASRIGWREFAADLMGQLEQRMKQATNVTSLRGDEGGSEVEGMPTRASVYGVM